MPEYITKERAMDCVYEAFTTDANAQDLYAIRRKIAKEPGIGWVSVKDRMPDRSGSYLVVLENVFVSYLTINVHYWNAKDEYWSGSQAHSRIIGISHWMPLPEPPEEVNGDA